MKYKFRLLISVIFFLVFALCCFVFRSMPVAKIWNNYSVLYTDNSVPEATVLFYLEQEGCRDVISLSGQKMPPLSQFTMPEAIDETYLDERLGYFSDESSSYQLFYIPDQYHDRAKAAAVSLIKGTGAEAGLDGHEQYPWLVPLICFVTYLLLTLCSKKKAVFMFTGIFPLLVSLSQPFYVVAAAVCLSLVAICLINGLWIRRKFFTAIFRSIYIDILIVASMAIPFASSFTAGLLGVGAFFTVTMSFVFLKAIHEYREYRSSFSFVPIFSAWQIPVMYRRSAGYVLGSVIPLASLLVLFLVSTLVTTTSSMAGLSIPSPVLYGQKTNGKSLPDENSYFAWVWKARAYPYKSLNDDSEIAVPSEGDRITTSHFTETERGIVKSEETIYTYNSKFRDKLRGEIKNFDYNAIEKLMIAQDETSTVSYNTGIESKSDSQHNAMNMFLLFIAISVPVILYGVYFGFGRKKNENSKLHNSR